MAGDSNIHYWLTSRGLPTDEGLVAAIRQKAKSEPRLLANEEVMQVVNDWRSAQA
jgi:hypothetical protein